MDDEGSLDILLVLCCLVGAVLFLCFSMGVVSIAAMGDRLQTQTSGVDPVAAARDLEEEVPDLIERVEDLERKVREDRARVDRALEPPSIPSEGARTEDASLLEKQIKNAADRAEQLRKELAELSKQLDAARAVAEVLPDLRRLQEEYANLVRTVEEKKEAVAARAGSETADPEAALEALRKAVAELETEKKRLDREAQQARANSKTFNPWTDFTGTTELKTPLFVECRKDRIVVQPEGKEFKASSLEKENPASVFMGQPDGIVFLIRPDGFDAFKSGYGLAKKLGAGVSICYEAVDADWTLRFSR